MLDPLAPALPSPVPAFSPRSRPSDLLAGVALPFRAIGWIFRSRALLGLSLLSALVTGLSLAALVAALWRWTGPLLARVWPRPENVLLAGVWFLVLALAFLVLLAVGASAVPTVLLSPLQDPLSEVTEALCGGEPAPRLPLARSLAQGARSLGHTLLRVAFLLGGHALLLGLHLVPVAGSLAWTVAATLWTMIWTAAEYLDAPMARHLYPFRAVRAAVWSRLPLCLGFGAAVYVLLWIPVLNFFFVPAAVVGGTLLFRGLRACGSLQPP